MKPHSKFRVGDRRREDYSSAMSTTHARPSANAALSGEVSLSFQDELAATIHGAFEVAVEIAVLEVTKLVGQALGDVRDQMHETLRENKSLKQRLQAAERELSARGARKVTAGDERRGRLVAADNQTPAPASPRGHPTPRPQANSRLKTGKRKAQRDEKPQPELQIGATLNVALEESYEYLVASAEISARHNGSFSEIREDGRVCSQELNPDLGREPAPNRELVTDIKRNSPSVYTENLVNFGQAADSAVKNTSSPRIGSSSSEVEEVKVKQEKAEPDHGSGSGHTSSVDAMEEDSFNPDNLSLAQSKLLEDWRPDPLPLEACNSDSLVPCSSLSLSQPPVFSSDTPDADTLTPATGGPPVFPSPFSNPFQPGETMGIPPSQHPFAGQMGGPSPASAAAAPPRMHVCKVCGEAFHAPGELRRHHSQRHSAKPGRSPKRQAFPPGRSPYHCSQCGRDFNRMENLKTHLRIHTGERPYACSVCGVRFRHSGALTRHFRIHTGEKPYVCSQCGKTFRNCGGLRFHQRSHTREGQGLGH
ncbi:zinc finger protein 16-like [Megalops cyprinoides]|uniref:zinc finger protein 16-like n=1 Tax=Megalops cyprinoides TaxID=118141 RepID=UPI001864B9F0|nr:zinc finger protein 16-like [Megalops cyprinoides]